MKNLALRIVVALASQIVAVTPTKASIATRPFSGDETAYFVTAGSEGGGWVGNTLTLFDGASSTDRIVGFVPDDAIGIYFEFSSTRLLVSGADVVLIKDQVDGNSVTDILSDVATKTAGNPWYASIDGPGISQRVDILPQETMNEVTIVKFFFAPETLYAPKQANVFDRLMFTTGHRDYPESFTYGNVSWILEGSTPNTRSSSPGGIVPELTSFAIWSILGAVGAPVRWRRLVQT